MNWTQAEHQLRNSIYQGQNLDPSNTYKIVVEVPPFKCKNYENQQGFRIQVGKKSMINIPLSMLKKLFEDSLKNKNIYNREIFKNSYPHELYIKPCYVHSIGKLFSCAGIMTKISTNNFEI